MANTDDRPIEFTLTRDHLLLINNALNEVCNGVHIDDFEFETRLGFSRGDARQLLRRVSERLREIAI